MPLRFANDEPQVVSDGGQCPVVLPHDSEAFEQRFLMILGGHALVEVVTYDAVCMMCGLLQLIGFLQDADAPIEVGREAVLHIVTDGAEQALVRKECLMAHQHTVLKRRPSKLFGRR